MVVRLSVIHSFPNIRGLDPSRSVQVEVSDVPCKISFIFLSSDFSPAPKRNTLISIISNATNDRQRGDRDPR